MSFPKKPLDGQAFQMALAIKKKKKKNLLPVQET